MKKIISLLLCFILCAPLMACNFTQDSDLNFEVNFDNIDSGKIALGEDANGVAISSFEENAVRTRVRDSFSGGAWKTNLNGVAVSVKKVKLKAGFYKFGVNAKTTALQQEKVVFEMRVIDNKSANVAGYYSFYNSTFKDDEYTKKEMSFYLEKDSTVDLQVLSHNTYEFFINELYVINVEQNDCQAQDISAFLKSSKEDDVVFNFDTLYYFDIKEYVKNINDTRIGYDIVNLVATLQGLVNREQPHLYVNMTGAVTPMSTNSVDNFWLDELRKDDAFLSGKEIQVIKKPATLLRIFKDYYNGLAVWDELVPATSNAVSTACGVDNLLPVRYDSKAYSLYNILTQEYNLKTVIDLHSKFIGNKKKNIYQTKIKSTGSKKNDAYLWAYDKYMKTEKVSRTEIAYYTDGMSWDTSNTGVSYTFYHYLPNYPYEFCFLGNKDYNIAQKSFFYDLFPFTETSGWTPNDDITQTSGEDYRTLELIYQKQHEMAGDEMFYIHGYNNFYLKYASGNNNVSNDLISQDGDVANEGVHGRMLAKYYGSAMGDALSYTNVNNRSIYSKMPRIDYKAMASKAPDDAARKAQNKYYFAFYMGDYDGSSWPYAVMPTMWNDPNRGKVPLMWPIHPSVERYIPQVYKFMYENKSVNDYFVGGNNGVGFTSIETLDTINDDGEKTMLDRFIGQTAREYNRMGLDVMGHLIVDATSSDACMRKYAKMPVTGGFKGIFSTYWSGVPNGNGQHDYLIEDVPVAGMQIDMEGAGFNSPSSDNFTAYLNTFMTEGKIPSAPRFNSIRTVLATPTNIYYAVKALADQGYNIEILDPYTYSTMLKTEVLQ